MEYMYLINKPVTYLYQTNNKFKIKFTSNNCYYRIIKISSLKKILFYIMKQLCIIIDIWYNTNQNSIQQNQLLFVWYFLIFCIIFYIEFNSRQIFVNNICQKLCFDGYDTYIVNMILLPLIKITVIIMRWHKSNYHNECLTVSQQQQLKFNNSIILQ